MKKAVKKTRQNSNQYARRKQSEHELWTMKVIAYVQQEMLDTAAIVLKNGFGFGPARQKKFHDLFEEVYKEVRDLEREDTEDGEYAAAKVEQALQEAWGELYEPREVRYDIRIIDGQGREFKV